MKRGTARVVVERNGRVLAVAHHGDPFRLGLPGGGIDAGETPEQAAVRELLEETGVRVAELQPLAVLTEPGRVNFIYRAVAPRGELRWSEEGPCMWLPPAELTKGKHGAFNRAALRAAGLRI